MSEPLPRCIYCDKSIKPEDQWVAVHSAPENPAYFGPAVSRAAHTDCNDKVVGMLNQQADG
jgi:hypothetical protein